MGKVIVTGYLQVPPAELPMVLEGLAIHIELSRQETGCLKFEIDQDAQDPNKLILYEEYSSQEAFEAHKQRSQQSNWAKLSQNVERFLEISEAGAN